MGRMHFDWDYTQVAQFTKVRVKQAMVRSGGRDVIVLFTRIFILRNKYMQHSKKKNQMSSLDSRKCNMKNRIENAREKRRL